MNFQSASFGVWGVKMKIFQRVKKYKFPLKFKWFFSRLLTYASFKRVSMESCIYILSSAIKFYHHELQKRGVTALSKSLREKKWAMIMSPVSIESTLLLFLLISIYLATPCSYIFYVLFYKTNKKLPARLRTCSIKINYMVKSGWVSIKKVFVLDSIVGINISTFINCNPS